MPFHNNAGKNAEKRHRNDMIQRKTGYTARFPNLDGGLMAAHYTSICRSKPVLTAVFAMVLTLATPMSAPLAGETAPQDGRSQREKALDMTGEAMDRLLGALTLLMRSIPRYAVPEVLENGDILIRRLPQQGDDEATPENRPRNEQRNKTWGPPDDEKDSYPALKDDLDT